MATLPDSISTYVWSSYVPTWVRGTGYTTSFTFDEIQELLEPVKQERRALND